jgi:hypothetical protein
MKHILVLAFGAAALVSIMLGLAGAAYNPIPSVTESEVAPVDPSAVAPDAAAATPAAATPAAAPASH